MTLTSCTECNAQISARADSCPHCGAPSTPKHIKDASRALIKIGLILLFFVFLVYVFF